MNHEPVSRGWIHVEITATKQRISFFYHSSSNDHGLCDNITQGETHDQLRFPIETSSGCHRSGSQSCRPGKVPKSESPLPFESLVVSLLCANVVS